MKLVDHKKDLTIVSAYFSEGCNRVIIDTITKTIEGDPNVELINVRPIQSLNRTNIIFGGDKKSILNAALNLAGSIKKNIDLRKLKGEQLPFGALNTISFMPLNSQYLAETVTLSKKFAKEVGEQLDAPVYFFRESDKKNQNLERFRKYNYKNIPELLMKSQWKPDFGTARYNQKLGAVIVGAHYYHVNLAIYFDTDEFELINKLTKVHRKEIPQNAGQVYNNPYPDIDGGFKELGKILKKIKTFVDDLTQEKKIRLLCNIPSYVETPLPKVIEVFRVEAKRLGIDFLGVQLFGYLPAEVLINTGKYFNKLEKENKLFDDDLRYMILAVFNLKLNSIIPFDLNRQILDNHIKFDLDHLN